MNIFVATNVDFFSFATEFFDFVSDFWELIILVSGDKIWPKVVSASCHENAISLRSVSYDTGTVGLIRWSG